MSDTAPVISDEAVEAAARALYTAGHHSNCATNGDPLKVKTVCDCYFDGYRQSARAILTAAYPYLLAQITEGMQNILAICEAREFLVADGDRDIETIRDIARAYGKATS